ncbi:MAG: FAD-binding protein, partial [Alphaproteobacteria bacterium]
MAALVVAEHDNTELKQATLHAVTAASQLDDEVHILVAGADSSGVAAAAAAVAGVAKVLHADDAAYGHGLAENLAPLIAGLAEDYDHLLACATTFGKNTMPRVAALLDVAQVSEISQILSADTFVRPTYAGNAMATVRSNDARKVITVRATAFDAAAPEGGSAAIEAVSGPGDQGLSRFERHELSVSERPELTSADIVVSGGRGMQSGDNFPLVEAVADRLVAAV